MSDNWFNDDENDAQENGGGGLRKQLEDALKRLKDAEKRAATAENKLAVTTASSNLKEKGYKPTAAKYAALDGVDVTDAEALEKWLTDNGDDFKVSDSAQSDNDDEQQQVEVENDATQVAGSQIAAQLRAVASPADVNKYEAALKTLPKDASGEETLAHFRAAGL